jgi:hypothetical protein
VYFYFHDITLKKFTGVPFNNNSGSKFITLPTFNSQQYKIPFYVLLLNNRWAHKPDDCWNLNTAQFTATLLFVVKHDAYFYRQKRRLRKKMVLDLDLPDGGGSKYLWNFGKLTPVYMALQPRRQPSAYSPPREPQILQIDEVRGQRDGMQNGPGRVKKRTETHAQRSFIIYTRLWMVMTCDRYVWNEIVTENCNRKAQGKRPLGRRRNRWKDNIKMHITETVWTGFS